MVIFMCASRGLVYIDSGMIVVITTASEELPGVTCVRLFYTDK